MTRASDRRRLDIKVIEVSFLYGSWGLMVRTYTFCHFCGSQHAVYRPGTVGQGGVASRREPDRHCLRRSLKSPSAGQSRTRVFVLGGMLFQLPPLCRTASVRRRPGSADAVFCSVGIEIFLLITPLDLHLYQS